VLNAIAEKILFVDDDAGVLDSVRRQFHKHFEIVAATSGLEALELLRVAGPFALIVADMMMAGMDGVEFLTRARQIDPDSVCIMLTGHPKLQVAMDALNKGQIFRFLTKPCPAETLAKAFRDGLAYYRCVKGSARYTYSVHVKDGRAVATDYSQGCLAVSGYSPAEYRCDPFLWLSIVLPQYRSVVTEQANKILAGVDVAPIEYQIIRKDGAVRWMRDTVICHYDDQGWLVRYDGLIEDIAERKLAERKLEKAAEEWRTTFDSITDWICIIDRDFKLLRANRAFAEAIGARYEDLVGKSCFEVLHGQDRPACTCPLRKTLESGQPAVVESYEPRFGIYLETSTSPIVDEAGCVVAAVHISRNITERKRSEDAIRESEERFRNFVETSPDIVFRLTRTGHIDYVSSRVKHLYGYEVDELLGAHILVTTPAGELPKALEAINKVLMGQPVKNLQISQRDKAGRIVPMEINAVPIEKDGRIIGVQGVMRDISERKRAEELLRMKDSAIESSINGIAFADLQGNLTFVNPSFLNMWGYSDSHEVLGKRSVTFWQSESEAEKVLQEVVNKDSWLEVLVAVRKDGSLFDAQLSTTLVRDQTGQPVCVMASFVDVTEAKRAEAELKKANEKLREHDRLKSEFVSTVSHELRTPLSIFKNIISNAIAGVMGKINPKLRENLRMADESISRLTRIIDDFLNISRIEAGKLKLDLRRIDLCTVVHDVVNSLAPLAGEKDIDMTSITPDCAVWVNGDYDRLVQVFTNLVGNAIKFTPQNGRVAVETTDLGDQVQVEVRDNGAGIEQKDLDKIFDRFVQIKKGSGPGTHGTGLGLTIAKELVGMHKGRITVESRVGEGSRFYVVLPKYSEHTCPSSSPVDAGSRPRA
jgi:PAS domain S-box-containing protein